MNGGFGAGSCGGSGLFGTHRLLVEQVEAVRAERLHDLRVDPHHEAFFVQKVPAILQATQHVTVRERQLADRTLRLVEALAADIAFCRLLAGLEGDPGSRLAEQALPLLGLELLAELGVGIVARAENVSDHLCILAVDAGTLSALAFKNTEQRSRNIRLERSLLVHRPGTTTIISIMRRSLTTSNLRSVANGRRDSASTVITAAGGSRLAHIELDLVNIDSGLVNFGADLLRANLGVDQAAVRFHKAARSDVAFVGSVVRRRSHLLGAVLALSISATEALRCGGADSGRCRASTTPAGDLTRRDGLVRRLSLVGAEMCASSAAAALRRVSRSSRL